MSTKAELACVYASLILVDDDIAVTVSIHHRSKSKKHSYGSINQSLHIWGINTSVELLKVVLRSCECVY